MFRAILLYALFASIFTLQKEALNYSEPIFLIGSRMFFAGIILFCYGFFWKKDRLQMNPKSLLSLFQFSIFCIYLTNILEISGLNLTTSSKTCLIYSLSPFLTSLVAFWILKEQILRVQWSGLLIGFLGITPIIAMDLDLTGSALFYLDVADCYILGAVVCSVCGWIFLKKAIEQTQSSPILVNGIGMTLGGAICLIHSFLKGETWDPLPILDLKYFLLCSIGLCIISNFVCYNLYGYLLKKYSATFMSFVGLVTPIFAAIFGNLFFQEEITWHYWFALGLFTIGLVIFHAHEVRKFRKVAGAEA